MYSYYCPLRGSIPSPLCQQCIYCSRYQVNQLAPNMQLPLMNTDIYSNDNDNDIKIYKITRDGIDTEDCRATTIKNTSNGYYNDNSEENNIKEGFTREEAFAIGSKLGIKWEHFDIEVFRLGLDIELEHGRRNPDTNITDDDPILTGKIVLVHLNKSADYYTRLIKDQSQLHLKYDSIKNFM